MDRPLLHPSVVRQKATLLGAWHCRPNLYGEEVRMGNCLIPLKLGYFGWSSPSLAFGLGADWCGMTLEVLMA